MAEIGQILINSTILRGERVKGLIRPLINIQFIWSVEGYVGIILILKHFWNNPQPIWLIMGTNNTASFVTLRRPKPAI